MFLPIGGQGLNLVVAAITLWNTVYLEQAAEALARSRPVD
jgi:TnpA family transposase